MAHGVVVPSGLHTSNYDYGLHYATLRLHYGPLAYYGVHYGLGHGGRGAAPEILAKWGALHPLISSKFRTR